MGSHHTEPIHSPRDRHPDGLWIPVTTTAQQQTLNTHSTRTVGCRLWSKRGHGRSGCQAWPSPVHQAGPRPAFGNLHLEKVPTISRAERVALFVQAVWFMQNTYFPSGSLGRAQLEVPMSPVPRKSPAHGVSYELW